MSAKKSYWQAMHIEGDRAKAACVSWFTGVADGLTPYKAEVLCDIATDREKKVRAFMTDSEGKHWQLERTRGGRTYSVSMKPFHPAKPEATEPAPPIPPLNA